MKTSLTLAIFLILFGLNLNAQTISEIDGIYYENAIPYTGSYQIFHENNQVKMEMNLVDGLKDGDVKVYFENGTLNEIRAYSRNVMNGTWITYNSNNIKISEAHYLDGKKDGKWLIWNDEGVLIYELEYTEGNKTGIWKNYNEKGEFVSERNYSLKD